MTYRAEDRPRRGAGRRRRAEGLPGLLAAGVFVCCAIPRGVLALEPPGMQGLGWPSAGDEEGKRLSFFAGASWGTDSNPRRAEDPAEVQKESLTEYLVGLALRGGNDHRRYDLACQGRSDRFLGQSDLDFDELSATVGLGTYSERFHLGVRGKAALLADPTDPDLIAMGSGELMRRFVLGVRPDMSISFGRTELALDYSIASTEFESSFSWLDLDETVLSGEIRWWRGEELQVFVHSDSGTVEGRANYDFSRLYAGWRSETPRRSGLELGVGVQTLTFASGSPEDESLFFGSLRTTRILSEGRASLDFACTQTSEPSASSAYKNVLAAQVRYRRASSRRFGWSIGVLADQTDCVEEAPSTPGEFVRLVGEFQINLEIGSPSRTHGRIYATAAYESRDAPGSQYDYERIRLLAGIALVH